ncbi:MAG: hypothetical protein HEQ27_08655 [Dolichospermum sp. JUN01]|jgi:hypothetical protein|nr:hypothetical protein [Dolichospermum sp. JUN01]
MQVIENNEFFSELSNEESADINGGGILTAGAIDRVLITSGVVLPPARVPFILLETLNPNRP